MATSSGTLDDELQRFLIEETPEEFMKDDTELKAGSYGFVYEVRLGGVLRIAKKLHKVFFEASQKEKEDVVKQFKKECLILNKLRHPNVVQFIGVYYGKRGKDDIALVMEKLECDLAGFLSDNSNIELSRKVSILHDVSYGLVYLHEYNPPIIHRDLTARNILLDKTLRAKIADVGMAKLMDKDVIKEAKYTRVPGQLFYMPPEAKIMNPSYSDKLDIFSFGHLCLHTLLEDYPEVYELPFAEAMRHEGMIEKRKRQTGFDKIGSDHILCSIIVRCLRDSPEERPTARQLNKLMNSLMDKESVLTPKLKVGLAHGERIAQCEHINLVMDRSFPVQIDGEACRLKPSIIEVGLKNKALLVRKVPRSCPEAPLQGVLDSIKLSVSKVTTEEYDALNCEPYDLIKEEQATQFSSGPSVSSAGGSDDAAFSAIQKGLIDAVKRGNVEKVHQYHKKGAKLRIADRAGLTPLHYAARLNKIRVVEYIIKNIPKEALDLVDEEKIQTALHKAAWYGYVDICMILVESGASLNILDYQNNNVLDKAMQSGIKELQDYFEGKMKAAKAITSENKLAI